ncbi:MAG TPA: hypothetical protein VFK20_16695 [Vicinamibacterales bacterium]|nr:hypothetical protein [Vicinamibacterales bacterium]
MRVLPVVALVTAFAAAPPPALEWTPLKSGVTVRLRGVSAASASVAWATGANGTILRTTNGGATWTPRPIPGTQALDFRDVDAISSRVAYVLSIGSGAASRIYRTSDGGAHWTLQFGNTDPKGFFDAMTFRDARRGLAIGDSVDGQFVIVRTTDGGAVWSRVPAKALPPALPGEGAFAASGSNIAVLGDAIWIGTGAAKTARVLHSADAGRTWTIADTPLAAGASAGIFSIAFRDPKRGIVVGGDYRKEGDATGSAAITEDGGRTWTAVKGLGGFRSAVAYVPRSRTDVVAVGPSGADVSHDNGRTWTAIAGPGYDAISFAPDGSVAYATGDGGRIGKLVVR